MGYWVRTEEKPINHKLKASDFQAQISTHFVLKLDQNLHSLQIWYISKVTNQQSWCNWNQLHKKFLESHRRVISYWMKIFILLQSLQKFGWNMSCLSKGFFRRGKITGKRSIVNIYWRKVMFIDCHFSRTNKKLLSLYSSL